MSLKVYGVSCRVDKEVLWKISIPISVLGGLPLLSSPKLGIGVCVDIVSLISSVSG